MFLYEMFNATVVFITFFFGFCDFSGLSKAVEDLIYFVDNVCYR